MWVGHVGVVHLFVGGLAHPDLVASVLGRLLRGSPDAVARDGSFSRVDFIMLGPPAGCGCFGADAACWTRLPWSAVRAYLYAHQ